MSNAIAGNLGATKVTGESSSSWFRGRIGRRADEPLDTTDRIVTPENIEFAYVSAGPLARGLAFLVDVLIWMLAFGAVWFVTALVFVLGIGPLLERAGLGSLVVALGEMTLGLVGLSLFATYWLMWGIAESRFNGRTIGKWLFGLRVVTTDGHPIAGWQAMVRTLVRSVEVLPTVPAGFVGAMFVGADALEGAADTESMMVGLFPTGLVALIAMIAAPRFQRLGDLVSGTMVVYEHHAWRPGLAVLDDPRTAALAEWIPRDFRVRRELARAISSYVHKRRYLTAHRRREIARYVSEPLIRRFGLPLDTSPDLLMCALYHHVFIGQVPSEQQVSLGASGTALATAEATEAER